MVPAASCSPGDRRSPIVGQAFEVRRQPFSKTGVAERPFVQHLHRGVQHDPVIAVSEVVLSTCRSTSRPRPSIQRSFPYLRSENVPRSASSPICMLTPGLVTSGSEKSADASTASIASGEPRSSNETAVSSHPSFLASRTSTMSSESNPTSLAHARCPPPGKLQPDQKKTAQTPTPHQATRSTAAITATRLTPTIAAPRFTVAKSIGDDLGPKGNPPVGAGQGPVVEPAARIGLLVDRGWIFGQRVSGCRAGSDPNFTG